MAKSKRSYSELRQELKAKKALGMVMHELKTWVEENSLSFPFPIEGSLSVVTQKILDVLKSESPLPGKASSENQKAQQGAVKRATNVKTNTKDSNPSLAENELREDLRRRKERGLSLKELKEWVAEKQVRVEFALEGSDINALIDRILAEAFPSLEKQSARGAASKKHAVSTDSKAGDASKKRKQDETKTSSEINPNTKRERKIARAQKELRKLTGSGQVSREEALEVIVAVRGTF